MEDRDISLKRTLSENGIEVNDEQALLLNKYYDMVVEKNKVMNLTAITVYDEFVLKHFVDSLSIVKTGIDINGKKIIDVGTGAGFPGIPLKIVYPDTDIVLMDSLNKRLVFLNEVIEALGLKQIRTVHGRAEELGINPSFREQFDLCVSRAVARLCTLSEYCIPFVKKGGYFISYKSGNIDEELSEAKKAIHVLGGESKEKVMFNLAGEEIGRSFVIINKVDSTPKKYPRQAGKPSKEPIV